MRKVTFMYNYRYYDKGLTSLPNDVPKYVGDNFWCHNNTKKFTEEEVRAVCDVKGYIYV